MFNICVNEKYKSLYFRLYNINMIKYNCPHQKKKEQFNHNL